MPRASTHLLTRNCIYNIQLSARCMQARSSIVIIRRSMTRCSSVRPETIGSMIRIAVALADSEFSMPEPTRSAVYLSPAARRPEFPQCLVLIWMPARSHAWN